MSEPVSCGHFEDLAVLYALGELEAPVRASIEEHARACSGCAAVLQREMALAEILISGSRAAVEQEPSDLLLARCRSQLRKSLDEAAAANRRRAWTSLFSLRDWIAAFHFSHNFHPAWSVALLMVVGILSGIAGWQGIGRTAFEQWGPAMMTVSAASPPAVAVAGTQTMPPPVSAPANPDTAPRAATLAPNALAQKRAAVNETAENSRVYEATDAGMSDAFPRSWFEAGAAQDREQSEAPRRLRRDRGEETPRTWRNGPPPRPSARLRPDAALDASVPANGGLAELSRRVESLWWGGVRVDPSEQLRRLVVASPPDYPEVARRAGIEGLVTLLLRIGRDGSVEDVQLLSGEPVLGRAAAEAVEQWRYQPAQIGGQPVNILTSVTLAFELR